MNRSSITVLCSMVLIAGLVRSARADDKRAAFNVGEIQAVLALKRLDGWLLHDHQGGNPVAIDLVAPDGNPTYDWFYFVPAQGQPTALVHETEAARFDGLPGQIVTYAEPREIRKQLKPILKGTKTVAMEYAPTSGISSLTRVDRTTVAVVEKAGPRVSSSAELVQFTKSLWRPMGRVSHYIVAHHLSAIRKLALAHLATEMMSGRAVSEYDLQQYIVKAYEIRGVDGAPPVVATGANSADPSYMPTAQRTSNIAQGDVLMLALWGRMAGDPRPIYSNITWMAYVGDHVPGKVEAAFQAVVQARDQTVELIRDRLTRRRAIRGFEADELARKVLSDAGYEQHLQHRTGHSLDTDVQGDGANLDAVDARDTRPLVQGSGFTIEPGIYFASEFGLRSEINVYIGRAGLEVTTPTQTEVTSIFAKQR